MKEYPKTYEDISTDKMRACLKDVEPVSGTYAELIKKFRTFFRSAHLALFDIIMKQIWMETQFKYKGSRRLHYMSNGFTPDGIYRFFMVNEVGISQKVISMYFLHGPLATYIVDFFPEFLKHDPFTEPQYFKYPYKHVTLDFLLFCYQCHDRLEMLDYAEKKKMTFHEFMNWGANHALSYNEELEKDMYMMSEFKSGMSYIHRLDIIKNGKGKKGKKGIFTKLYD